MKPELFNTPMTRAILEGRKTVTRRLIKPQPKYCTLSQAGLVCSDEPIKIVDGLISAKNATVIKARYEAGDILYVREAFDELPVNPNGSPVDGRTALYYRADGDLRPEGWQGRWKPSLHMPKEAARIFLRVTKVRVERLQSITYDDAIREGADRGRALNNFAWIWDSTVKPSELEIYGWDADPWVWVVEFERISREEAYGG